MSLGTVLFDNNFICWHNYSIKEDDFLPRKSRLQSEYLHVIVRGIGRQILFEDDSDYNFFLESLKKYSDETGIKILAYCLMENHVHLLLRDSTATVTPLFMKKLGVRYSGYYNKKYDRVGHLFQDRYKSENIIDNRYLLAVYRYILKNPEKAGISKAKNYRWSSYNEYGLPDMLTDSSILVSLIGENAKFESFMACEDATEYMDYIAPKHDDEWAKKIIQKTVNAQSGTVIEQMPRPQRDEILALLKSEGLSVRQIERLTGINRGVVQKA